MGRFVKAASTGDIAEGRGKSVEVEGRRIAVFNLGGEFHAIDDACTHRGGSLGEGEVEGEEVGCPLHGARFNVKTGEVLSPPAPSGVTRHAVRVSGNDLEVEIE